MVTAAFVRAMKGRRVEMSLSLAGGGGTLEGRIVSCLESADGLVAYLDDTAGRSHTIHYQHIVQMLPLDEPGREV
jgi:hypothetical protein